MLDLLGAAPAACLPAAVPCAGAAAALAIAALALIRETAPTPAAVTLSPPPPSRRRLAAPPLGLPRRADAQAHGPRRPARQSG